MFDGHYLNLPVVANEGDIIGVVEVLKLTHITLNQIKQLETSEQAMAQLQLTQPMKVQHGTSFGLLWTIPMVIQNQHIQIH